MDGHDNTQSRLWAEIAESKAHGVILLGWLRKLFVPHSWQNRVINSHPSLLPLFGGKGMWGARVHRAAIDSGMRVSGCTYHFVDNEYDSGPIIAQYSTPIADSDTVETLTSRVISMQHKSLLPVMNAWAEYRFREIGNRWVGAPSQEHLPD
jgi:phosphoribosylglycinamide formyltransferase-1